MDIMSKVDLAFSSNNTLDGSTSADNLIKSHQLDFLSSGLIPAETVDNDQENLAAIRYITRH